MSYYFNKKVNGRFDEIAEKVIDELQKEGFGILTEIDVKATLKKKMTATPTGSRSAAASWAVFK